MSSRARIVAQGFVLLVVAVLLVVMFPRVMRFAEMAARELRYFWWVILLVALGAWLVWGLGRKRQV